jgi:xanthine dehydrogenase molybdenum-binding subunit
VSTLPDPSRTQPRWSPSSYAADLVPRPVLYGAALRAERAGVLRATSVDRLRSLPGVVAVLTPEDDDTESWSGSPHGGPLERRILTPRPRCAGDVIAAVVATSPEALAAARAAFTAEVAPSAGPDARVPGPAFGAPEVEVSAALAAAPVRHRLVVELDPGPQGAMERPAAAARWVAGRLTLWSTTQCPQPLASRVAEIFRLDTAAVTVVPAPIGGGFGGKEEVILEPLAALLSRACDGATVLVEMSRQEALLHYRRHGALVTTSAGLDTDGRLLARWVELDLRCGAYLGHADHIASNGLRAALSLYRCAAAGGTSTLVLDQQPGRGAYRGYGSPQVGMATEHQLDLVATQLGLSPYQIRRINLVAPASADPWRAKVSPLAGRALACLDALEAEPDRPAARGSDGSLVGVGLALAINVSSITAAGRPDVSQARCSVTDSGFDVRIGAVDMGQGIHRSARIIAAEALDCDPATVSLSLPASDEAPPDAGSFASRGAYVVLGAVHAACLALRARLDEVLGAGESLVRAERDGLHTRSGRIHSWQSVSGHSADGRFAAPDDGMSVAAQRVAVAVDPQSCTAVVTSVASVHDVGRLIDRSRAELQVVGGVLQGIGWMLRELDTASGTVPTMLHAGLPTVYDAPPTAVTFLEEPNPESPIGARGLGEIPTIAMLPAIANALHQITGRAVTRVPMGPDQLAAHFPVEPRVDHRP